MDDGRAVGPRDVGGGQDEGPPCTRRLREAMMHIVRRVQSEAGVPILMPTKRGARPRPHPDSAPDSVLLGAAVLLPGQLVQASEVLGFSQSMLAELSRLRTRCLEAAGLEAA